MPDASCAPRPWDDRREYDLTAENLQALFDDRIPAIRVRGFATAEECASVTAAIREVGMQHVYRFESRVGDSLSTIETGYIGLTHYNYRHKPKQAYIDEVPEAIAHRDRVFERSFDGVGRMVDLLQSVSSVPVHVAEEPDGSGPLYAGIIRDATTGGDLHADFAPYTARGLVVGGIDAQIGWNAWFEHPEQGGATTIHHQPWTEKIEGDAIPEQYPLDRDRVAGAETYTYRPSPGDAILFNTRNPHEISGAAPGDTRSRLQVGSFIGRVPGGDLLLWS